MEKEKLINYLVDVLGHDLQEAKGEVKLYKTCELLSPEQLEECIAFNK